MLSMTFYFKVKSSNLEEISPWFIECKKSCFVDSWVLYIVYWMVLLTIQNLKMNVVLLLELSPMCCSPWTNWYTKLSSRYFLFIVIIIIICKTCLDHFFITIFIFSFKCLHQMRWVTSFFNFMHMRIQDDLRGASIWFIMRMHASFSTMRVYIDSNLYVFGDFFLLLLYIILFLLRNHIFVFLHFAVVISNAIIYAANG